MPIRAILRGNHMIWRLTFLFMFVLTACSAPPEVEVPLTLGPTPTRAIDVVAPATTTPAPSELIVCLFEEPASLYLYADTGRAADMVLAALYDGPLDLLGYDYQPVLLEKLPSLADGDLRIVPVELASGDVYFNPETLQPETFAFNKPFLPSGCTADECVQIYRGGGATIDRLEADFRLVEGVTWSDGTPVTAADSVFSFRLDTASETPTTKYLVDRTIGYEAIDERTVRWIGIPGYLDPEARANFWTPLPTHRLGGKSAEELLTDEEANRAPLGWGPYMLERWESGRMIRLVPNPTYTLAGSGTPGFDTLTFRFIEDDPLAAIQQVVTGECDLLDEFTLDSETAETLVSLRDNGRLAFAAAPGSLVERLEFNLSPVGGGAALFADLRTRQGLAACINRSRIVDEILAGFGGPTDSFLAPEHPLYASDLEAVAYDPAAGAGLLTEAGWLDADQDPETPRVADGSGRVSAGTPLVFTLAATDSGFRRAIAEQLQSDFAACGAELELDTLPPDVLYAAWPQGPVFGRTFQTVLWSWPVFVSPPCEMFAGWEIPSETNPLGINASGLSSAPYDTACRTVLLGSLGDGAYERAAGESQALFAASNPAIPLYVWPRLVVHRTNLCGIEIDPSAETVLWNAESLHQAAVCP